MEAMSANSGGLGEFRRFVIEEARAARATHALVAEAARAERRRGRRLRARAVAARERNLDLGWRLWSLMAVPEPPSTIPLSWEAECASEEANAEAVAAAEECARRCTDALRAARGAARTTLASIAGVSSFAAEHGHASSPDSSMALSLCVRVIEASASSLDDVGSTNSGVQAASAARRCAMNCKRALAAMYPGSES
jgi:hypothetical protein